MSTPRDVRLLRVPSLRAMHRAVAMVGCHDQTRLAGRRVVLVPSRAAADALTRTLEGYWLDGWRPSEEACAAAGVVRATDLPTLPILPQFETRGEWYEGMRKATLGDRSLLSTVEREVLLGASAREAIADGSPPPFRLGPGLLAEMIDFYDALRRNMKTVDDFERLLTGVLETSADLDRGAARMLQQTRFLVASLRRFESRCEGLGALDEHGLRARLAEGATSVDIRHLVVALPDRTADTEGLWPADFDLIARVPGIERVDVVATEAQLAAGLHERLHERLPGLTECCPDVGADERPVLLVPEVQPPPAYFSSRDREDELADCLRRMLSATGPGQSSATQAASGHFRRRALVYQRPLPYLYLARQLLESAGVPYEAIDSLPLAAEPYVAAFDLVMSFVTSGCTRASTVAMLSSPHLRFAVDGDEVTRREVRALDDRWAGLGFMGSREPLDAVAEALSADECRRAVDAALMASVELAPLRSTAPPSVLLSAVIEFLDRHDRPSADIDLLEERRLRSRGALLETLRALCDAEVRFADHPTDVGTLRGVVRRWIEGQTFAPRTGVGGITLTDTRAAVFGDFDEVHLLGLVEGEWPSLPDRNIFFPPSLLRELGWTGEKERISSARATFTDLLALARRRTSVSTFFLEDDAIVRPSALLEDLAEVGIDRRAAGGGAEALHAVVKPNEHATPWAELRASRPSRDDPRFHGFIGSRSSKSYRVTALETYLACPFKYFAARELGLRDDSTADSGLTPLERGRTVHEVLEEFFASWVPPSGSERPTDSLRVARRRFEDIIDRHLARLPESERRVERDRFLGTASTVGICDRILAAEASLTGDVVERLTEHALRGEYPVVAGGEPGWRSITGKADRIDLLAGGALRVIDYKSGKAPRPDRALQLPIYAACAERQLEGWRDRSWTVETAGYVALASSQPLVLVIDGPGTREASITRAEQMLTDTVEAIEAGQFPPRPWELRLCRTCTFTAICRKDYVDVETH